jgi:hypothetical protein
MFKGYDNNENPVIEDLDQDDLRSNYGAESLETVEF